MAEQAPAGAGGGALGLARGARGAEVGPDVKKVLTNAVTLNTAGNQTVIATEQPAGITGTSDPIAVSNPVPTLSSINVTSAVESSTPVSVTVSVSVFVPVEPRTDVPPRVVVREWIELRSRSSIPTPRRWPR